MAVFQQLAEIKIWSPNFHSSLHFFTIYLQLIIKRDIYPLFINYLSFLSMLSSSECFVINHEKYKNTFIYF